MKRRNTPPRKTKKASFLQRLMGRREEEYNDLDDMDGDGEYDDYDETMDDEEEEGIQEFDDMVDEELQINLVDRGNVLVAQALVPGLTGDDIDVSISREMLTIKAQSNEHHIEKEGNYLYEEVNFGSFSRSIILPMEVEVEESEAEIQNGVLKITMPKIDKTLHKKINVRKK